MSGRMVRLSKRAERKLFAGYLPIDLARNPAMAARRMARRARKHSGYCLPGLRRAYRAKNVLGRVIWANKPRRFGGLRWLEGRACMASFVEFLRRCERARAALAERDQALYGWSRRREWHQFGFNAYAATSCRWPLGLRWDFPHVCDGRGVVAGGPLDAPEEMAAGSVVSCMGEPHGRLTLRGEDFAAMAGRLDRQGGVW